MTAEPHRPASRRASVRAFAKINLGLKVLHKRPDGFHELRTIFQTVSLADRLEIEFSPGAPPEICVDSTLPIEDNLVVRAARLVLEESGARGAIRFRLSKEIPMGAGLGGGSSDAAAVLLGLPALAGIHIPLERLIELGAQLGSDVPFFLLGGRAVALGRGTELYPLPDQGPRAALVIAPGIHVSTPEAYRALGRALTSDAPQNMISSFQSFVWKQTGKLAGPSDPDCVNDFETAVFGFHPRLGALKRQLQDQGAQTAALSGSGSALFGLFGSRADADRALASFGEVTAFPVSFVSRKRYQSLWWRWLAPHIVEESWPPRSRYA
jgi:4-diphosphocytidyl-2-C-methyl-D-erythritol kinase